MSNKEKGFTLIELLVVIAIIGILSSVVLASIKSAREEENIDCENYKYKAVSELIEVPEDCINYFKNK